MKKLTLILIALFNLQINAQDTTSVICTDSSVLADIKYHVLQAKIGKLIDEGKITFRNNYGIERDSLTFKNDSKSDSIWEPEFQSKGAMYKGKPFTGVTHGRYKLFHEGILGSSNPYENQNILVFENRLRWNNGNLEGVMWATYGNSTPANSKPTAYILVYEKGEVIECHVWDIDGELILSKCPLNLKNECTSSKCNAVRDINMCTFTTLCNYNKCNE